MTTIARPYDMLLTLSGGPLHRPDPLGTGAAHVKAPLTPQEHRAAGQQRQALRRPRR